MNRRSFLRLGMLSSAAAFATVPRALAVAEPAWTVTVDFFHAGTVPYHQGNGCSPAPSHQLLELCDGQFLQRERLHAAARPYPMRGRWWGEGRAESVERGAEVTRRWERRRAKAK